uniref:Uncharacterized protein n=1 Tax=Glossina pallidipes TaxID=7398 RepID=A0A1B0AEE9_GLOPL
MDSKLLLLLNVLRVVILATITIGSQWVAFTISAAVGATNFLYEYPCTEPPATLDLKVLCKSYSRYKERQDKFQNFKKEACFNRRQMSPKYDVIFSFRMTYTVDYEF